MGRRVMQPRLVAYMADHAGLSYTYSGSSMAPLSWNDAVLRIKVGASLGDCRRYKVLKGAFVVFGVSDMLGHTSYRKELRSFLEPPTIHAC